MLGLLSKAVGLLGGIAVSKAMHKVLPLSPSQFQGDPIGTIGAVLIHAVASDLVTDYISNRIDGITTIINTIAADPNALPEPEPIPAPAPKPTKARK